MHMLSVQYIVRLPLVIVMVLLVLFSFACMQIPQRYYFLSYKRILVSDLTTFYSCCQTKTDLFKLIWSG